MATIDYMLEWQFPNGRSFRELALYASDATALAGCKRRFRNATPGEKMTLVRKGGEIVFTLERPLALEAS
jgi:hypothetical protein